MTIEELQSKVSDLEAKLVDMQSERDSVNAKNKELLGENKKLKAKSQEVDVEKHFQLAEDYENLKSEFDKLSKTSKLETEKLTKSLTDKDSALQRYLIEEGLSSNLAKSGVKKEFMEAAKALLRSKAQLKEDNGELKAFIGDKGLSDAISEWVQGDEGKYFTAPSQNFGGGSSNNPNGGSADLKKYFDKSSPEFSLTKQAEILKQDPALYQNLKG